MNVLECRAKKQNRTNQNAPIPKTMQREIKIGHQRDSFSTFLLLTERMHWESFEFKLNGIYGNIYCAIKSKIKYDIAIV